MMRYARKVVVVGLIALLLIPALTWWQGASDSREKWEKVGDILAALQAEPGKRIADVGAGEGFYTRVGILLARGARGREFLVDSVPRKSSLRRNAALVGHAFIGWPACGATIAIARQSLSMSNEALPQTVEHGVS